MNNSSQIYNAWYDRKSVIIVFLLLLFPIGVFLIWKKQIFSKQICLLITIAGTTLITMGLMMPTPEIWRAVEGARNTFFLVASLMFLMWGLTLFKIYIRIWGVFIGLVVGGIIGIIFNIHPWATGILFAIIGGLVAWPIQKAIVFISIGLLGAFLSMVLYAIVAKFSAYYYFSQTLLLFSTVAFFISGFIAVKLYDYFVILNFAIPSALTLFHLSYSSAFNLNNFYWNKYNPAGTFLRLIEAISKFYLEHFMNLLLIVSMFVFFSIYFQKFMKKNKDDSESQQRSKALFRRVTYFVIIVTIIRFFYLSVYESVIIVGINTLVWPLIIYFCYRLVQLIEHKKVNFSCWNIPILNDYGVPFIIGFFILPLFASLLTGILKFDFSYGIIWSEAQFWSFDNIKLALRGIDYVQVYGKEISIYARVFGNVISLIYSFIIFPLAFKHVFLSYKEV